MLDLLIELSLIPSGSHNLDGLAKMIQAMKRIFASLGGVIQEISLPPKTILNQQGELVEKQFGKALTIRKRPEAPVQILLSGHLDTVYTDQHITIEKVDRKILKGPGVADMKGGLVVMLKALKIFEETPFCQNIGWEVILNPDEEIGSIGSSLLLEQCAKGKTLGLVFEPALADGALVSERKGSVNLTLICRGKAAHAGRDFHQGRNAIEGMARVIKKIEEKKSEHAETTINVGYITGGSAVNIVPDYCLVRMNIRSFLLDKIQESKKMIEEIVKREGGDFAFEVMQDSDRPPKVFDKKTENLYSRLKECADKMNMPLSWKPSGGASDGNILAAKGLPVIDSLGVVGGSLHSPDEFMLIDSLVERAMLVTLFLMKRELWIKN